MEKMAKTVSKLLIRLQSFVIMKWEMVLNPLPILGTTQIAYQY